MNKSKIFGIALNSLMMASLFFENFKIVGMVYVVITMTIGVSFSILLMVFPVKRNNMTKEMFDNYIINFIFPLLFSISFLITKQYVFAIMTWVVQVFVIMTCIIYGNGENHE